MTLYITLVIVLGVGLFWWLLRGDNKSQSASLCDVFELPATEYTLIGTDLGGSENRVFLRADQVVGVPDAIFRGRGSIIIGEAKSRHYRGHLTDYENYQVQLYMGAASRTYRKPCRAKIRYGCGSVVPVEFDQSIYDRLLRLIPSCQDALGRMASD